MFARVLCVLLSLIVFAPAVAIAQPGPAKPASVADSVNYMWKDLEKDFTALADAMPEDKWNFKPTQGEFKGVRTFAEQVKHVACANVAWARKLRGETPPDRCDLGGPDPANTKPEIMKYLRESFRLVDEGVAGTTRDNMLTAVHGPYAGDNRLEVLIATIWHVSDHYGQLVEYLRMNGIVPPASR